MSKLLYIPGAPLFIGWIIGGFAIVLGLAHRPRIEPGYVLSLEWREWVTKKWKYSTTILLCIIYQPESRDDDTKINTRIERHEHVHIRQMIDTMLVSWLLGIILAIVKWDWILGVSVWVSGGVWILTNYITAGLRYGFTTKDSRGNPLWYKDAEHERSAYAQTDLPRKLGTSWQELVDETKAR